MAGHVRAAAALAALSLAVLLCSPAAAGRAQEPPAAPAPKERAAGDATDDPLAPARQALREGREEEAAELLRRRLTDVPGDDRTRYLLVRALLALDDLAAAAESAEVARQEAPDHALTFLALADVMVRRGQLAGAERFYREAVRRDRELAWAHRGLGRMLESQGERASALAAYRTAHELAPHEPALSLSLATLTADPAERQRLVRAAADDAEDPALQLRLAAALPLLAVLGDREPCRLVAAPESASLSMPELDFHQRSLSGAVAGGREAPFLLDTGASGLLFDEKLAAKAGIEPVSPVELGGIGDWGSLTGATAIAPEIAFGPLRFADCPISIADTRFRIGERGVVGADFFSDFVVHFDFAADRLVLERLPVLVDGAGAPSLADRDLAARGAGWSPARLWYGDVLVQTRINASRTAWFVLDTGGQFNLLDRGLAAELVQLKRYTKLGLRGFSGEVQEVYQAQQRVTLSFAGLEQGNDGILAMDLSPLSSAVGLEIGGILGYELLRHLDLGIDYRNALVRLRPR